MLHYGLCTVWPGCQLGGQGLLRSIRSPRRQLGELQLGERQDVVVSPRGSAHVKSAALPQGAGQAPYAKAKAAQHVVAWDGQVLVRHSPFWCPRSRRLWLRLPPAQRPGPHGPTGEGQLSARRSDAVVLIGVRAEGSLAVSPSLASSPSAVAPALESLLFAWLFLFPPITVIRRSRVCAAVRRFWQALYPFLMYYNTVARAILSE
jgi:hypothetical protein